MGANNLSVYYKYVYLEFSKKQDGLHDLFSSHSTVNC